MEDAVRLGPAGLCADSAAARTRYHQDCKGGLEDMTETEQYHAQAIDELTAKMDRLENQVEFLTKHIRLMDGVYNKEFRSVDQVFDKIFAMENKQ